MTTKAGIQISRVIRHARFFNAQNWQGAPVLMEDLLLAVNNLFDLLEQRKLNYVLVGGIALLQYVQGRNTEDIDLILNVSALRKIPEISITSKSEYFARGTYQDLQIDFLLTKNPLFAYVQKQHTTPRQFFERTVTSATVQGLLLLKLYALPSLYRQGDFARVGLYENDVATLMFYHSPDMEEITSELRQFVSAQDLSSIEDILLDLTQRISRFQQNKDEA